MASSTRSLRPRLEPKTDAPLSSVKVTWTKHPNAGPTVAQFKIKIQVFFEEGNYDISNWRYQQQAYDETRIIAGPNAGLHDKTKWDKAEPYTAEWSESPNPFEWLFIDQPGYSATKGLKADDEIDYRFAAKWRIWNDKLGKDILLGPYFGQILGARQRTYAPDDLSWIIKVDNLTLTALNGLQKGKPSGCPW